VRIGDVVDALRLQTLLGADQLADGRLTVLEEVGGLGKNILEII